MLCSRYPNQNKELEMSTIPQNEPGTDVEDQPPATPESPVEAPDEQQQRDPAD
jgi:hypothetical protein